METIALSTRAEVKKAIVSHDFACVVYLDSYHPGWRMPLSQLSKVKTEIPVLALKLYHYLPVGDVEVKGIIIEDGREILTVGVNLCVVAVYVGGQLRFQKKNLVLAKRIEAFIADCLKQAGETNNGAAAA